MPRLYGYAPKGQRCFGKHDWNAKKRTNVIGALLGKILLTVCLFQTYIDSDIFHAWVVQDLLPKLPLGAVIIMDNASFHKRQDTQNAIRSAGFILEYLPTYSPDLKPIEKKWAQVKAYRRKIQCSIDQLFETCFA